MASTPPYNFHNIFTPFPTSKLQRHQPTTIRSHRRFRDDEGRKKNIVDANMAVLRRRMEEERLKEERWYRSEDMAGDNGWRYKAAAGRYDDSFKRRALISEAFEVAASVGRSIGLVFLSGSIFLYLYSLLLIMHLHK